MAAQTRRAIARAVVRHIAGFLRGAHRVLGRDDSGEAFSPSQKAALLLLEERGPLPMGHVARALGLTTPAASRIVDRLERSGLARRRPGPNRRTVLVAATRKGRSTAVRFRRRVEALVSRALARLPRDVRPQIVAYYQALEEAVAEVAGARPPR